MRVDPEGMEFSVLAELSPREVKNQKTVSAITVGGKTYPVPHDQPIEDDGNSSSAPGSLSQ